MLRLRAGICILVLCLAPNRVAAAAPQPAPQTVNPDDLQRLVATLQDDKARARLVEQLQALIAAQRGAGEKEPAANAFFSGLSRDLDALAGEILAGVGVAVDLPRSLGWARRQLSDAAALQRWGAWLLAFVLVFGSAVIAEWVVRQLLGRLLPRTSQWRCRPGPLGLLLRLPLLLMELLPIGVFAGSADLVLAMVLGRMTPGGIVLSLLVEAVVTTRLVLRVAKFVLLLDGGLLPLAEETGNYLYIWVARSTCCAVFGYTAAAAAWWLGVPGGVYALMLKLTGLVLAILAVIFVLQNRAAVALWIGGPRLEMPANPGWYRLRRSAGEIWHLLAVLYILGIYAIYALRVEGGIAFVLRATVLSLLIILVARLLARFAEGLSRRSFAVSPELMARFPTLEQRVNRYIPILTRLAAAILYLFAALAVLQAWNIQSFAWLGTGLGRRSGGALLSIALVLVVALLAWELFSSAIERHLTVLDAAGGAPRRARLRTLLPLLRTAMLCVIVVIVALMVLSQLGIDIAPLLAGAGVVGLAVGFGSQALVKDVITGLFILVEDQIAVGDYVDVGKDHKGLVEAISVRTIRLRDQAGIVHTVPFSEVTSVKNLTKDFSCVVARIAIAYSEDIDRVVDILREASEQLLTDEALRPLILDPFEYLGVDALDEFSVVLLLRIRTVPGKHLIVGRAFNRLVKMAFDRHGVVSRDPNPILIAGATPGFAAEPAPSQGFSRARSG